VAKKKTRKAPKKIIKKVKKIKKTKKRVAKKKNGLIEQAKEVRRFMIEHKELASVDEISEVLGGGITPKQVAANKRPSEDHKPNPKFSVWENAKCGTCGHDGSNDPNGENYLYKLTCPDCGREGCDECIPSGRGCPCPECEDSERDESNANIDEDAGDDIVDDDPTDDEG